MFHKYHIYNFVILFIVQGMDATALCIVAEEVCHFDYT
jgi:hypothetical protein